MSNLSRRDFLKLTRDVFLYLSGALALGGLLRFLDYAPNPAPKTEFDLGPAANYPPGSRTLLSDPPAALLHTESGFSAFSLVCTHLGCALESVPDGFACPCHASKYDLEGNVLNGPAEKRLSALKIEITPGGNLVLHAKQEENGEN